MPSRERERALAVAAVAGVLDRCWAVREGLDGVDWPWLLARLDEHGLGALVFAEAERAGVLERFPAAAQDQLRRRAEDTAAANAQLLAAALRAGALLDAAGIPWMAMKGVALAIVAPEYASSRVTSDIDLVVRPQDLDRAAAALGERLPSSRVATDFEGEGLGVASAESREEHHLHTFDAGGVALELHHALPGLTPSEASDVWSRAAVRTVRGARVLAPALDDQLGIACVHALVVHAIEPRVVLRHVADTRTLIGLGADAETSRARFDARGRRAVGPSIRNLSRACRYAEARGRAPCAASDALDPGAVARARGVARRVGWMVSRSVRRLRDHGARAVFPSRAFLVARYGPSALGRSAAALHLRRWTEILLRTIKGR